MDGFCRICSESSNGSIYQCYEKMFGWGDTFKYFQCARCGCLQIVEVPTDLSRFYPPYYYSFRTGLAPQHGIKSWLARKRDLFALAGVGHIGKLISRIAPPRPEVTCLRHSAVNPELRILDLGCGGGHLLSILRRAGFERLAGVDPLLPNDIWLFPDLQLRKATLDMMSEQFDIIMLHHVLEHLASPLETLQQCAQRLRPGGKIVLRFPTVDSNAWEQYRTNWVQLDAPRHLLLHSRRSVTTVAERAGLEVRKWWCDSTAFQFWGSELYQKGVPLFDAEGGATRPDQHFTKMQMREFARAAENANKLDRGDQVAVVLSAAEDAKRTAT